MNPDLAVRRRHVGTRTAGAPTSSAPCAWLTETAEDEVVLSLVVLIFTTICHNVL